ncbi:unknown [Bacteroides sp. CAG:443]|nr:unknown [Bacteroides sp. CAG:443]
MVDIRQVNTYTQDTCNHKYSGRFQELRETLFLPCRNSISYGDKQHDKEEIIRHLHVVRHNLQCHEQSSHQTTPQILTSVYQDHTCYGRRYVSKCHKLPDMSGSNDDKEVGRKSPDNCSQGRQPDFKIECAQQDVEAQQHDKDVSGISREKQPVDFLNKIQCTARFISRSQLISRHSTEQRVCPSGSFAMLFVIFLMFSSGSDTCYSIVLCQDASFCNGRKEISDRYYCKEHNRHNIREKFL